MVNSPAKSTKPSRANKITKTTKLTMAEAIKFHANAIDRLAEAISSKSSTNSFETLSFALKHLAPLTVGEILEQLCGFFNVKKLTGDENITDLERGGPAFFVSGYEDLDNIKAFRQRGLSLRPEDIANVSKIKQLVGVILWGLDQARKAGSG
ncbi:hypothetical protein RFM23_28315 [Mesorhizobium abyssinicae]|uniref:Uncharacterized protein n=1 Tax=Mesorhizobium abyssinicae TaxID=1209958 RepID=A0ABU5AWK8_9HYPH|nr:hypothetical protein [Mesorhizobium abyssinicae]MDX8541534.1 hypothetical protein [Mesorhizobium abyssinicae]